MFATVPEGVFPGLARSRGEPLSSDWWRVERDGRVVAYGWLDDVWGDAEILLAVEEAGPGQRRRPLRAAHGSRRRRPPAGSTTW